MTGESLQTVGNCLSLAGVEEVVICSQVYDLVSSDFTTVPRLYEMGAVECVLHVVTGDKSNWQVDIVE